MARPVGAGQALEGGPSVGAGVVVLERGAQHAFMLSYPADDPADQSRQSSARPVSTSRSPPAFAQHAFAVARGEFDQRVEIGVLAFEPAVEGADGGADLPAQRLDRQFREAVGAQQLRAGLEQGGRGFAAALLARRGHAGEVEFGRSRRHPELASPSEVIIIIIRIMVFGNVAAAARARAVATAGGPADQPRPHTQGRKAWRQEAQNRSAARSTRRLPARNRGGRRRRSRPRARPIFSSCCSTTWDSPISVATARRSKRRPSTNSPQRACATRAFTPPRCVRPRARRC